MTSSDEYSPFLKWSPTERRTADSVAPPFASLVSMVRDGFQFDVTLLRKTSTLFSSIRQLFKKSDVIDDVMKANGQGSPNPAAVILSTPHLRDLSVIGDQDILKVILAIFRSSVWISSPDTLHSLSATLRADPDSIRDLVLHEVFTPIEPSLVQISRNHHILSWMDACQTTLDILVDIFDASDLSFNKISTIEHSVFSTLLELRLTRNQLRSFPHNINILFPVLHSLSLTPNRIKKCALLDHSTLTVLDLSRNNISSIDKPLVVPTLTSLSLALNRLTSFVLPNGSQLPCLQILDLRMNYLETLNEQAFESLPTIKSLYLTSNELESLPDRLGDILPNLSTNPIDIFGGTNELVSCPAFLMRSTGDLRVDIPNNRLRTLPRLSCDVVVFSADSSRISEIGEGVERLVCDYSSDVFAWPSRMKRVSLKDNLISSLPKTLVTLPLTCILLADNLLTDLLDGLFTLPILQTLDVSFNSLAIIPPSISQLTSLVKVNFGFKQINAVPNELFHIPTLTHLILSHNKLTSLPTDPAMSPKVELSLGFVDPLSNSMIYKKTGTGAHPGAVLCRLERLLFASILLTSVPPLVSRFRTFHTLSLAANGISELLRDFFRSLPNLSRLDLSFTGLTHPQESTVAVSLPAILRNMHSTHPSHTDTDVSRHTAAGLTTFHAKWLETSTTPDSVLNDEGISG
ncbi:putative leucine-rich repeat domain-containing protein [Blattamonas nauphoetae]|uniref:Leucine-rich repeat domain-containing protein n=1 Tax=Blattamonas nauphoetae TaxID=2049346 RepID=A0ABQ9XTP1_9EUKA|nr:putative leucine-rich repeat domain-containing protein [Blattamonas nauphoetae]